MTRFTRRWSIRCAFGLFVAAGLASLSSPTLAADYPSQPIRIVVGFPPGGGNDVLARLIAANLQDSMQQPVVVENRPGADGFIAFDAVKRAQPDGYTLLVGPSSGMTVNPVVYAKLPYDPQKDFAPITLIGRFPLVVTINPSFEATNLADLIARAKAAPDTINFGSAATSFRIATEMFAQKAGIRLHHVPYKGSAQAVQGVRGNEVPLTFADSAAVSAQIRAGALKALAVSSGTRVPSLPDVPTVKEAGLPGYEVTLWSALFAPAGTPQAVVDRLREETVKALASPDVRERLDALGVIPVGSTPRELEEVIEREIKQFRAVAKAAGIEPQ